LQLLTLLNEQLLIELGNPLGRPEPLPNIPARRCPAEHNRALLDRRSKGKEAEP
jgi:hypothetical protein